MNSNYLPSTFSISTIRANTILLIKWVHKTIGFKIVVRRIIHVLPIMVTYVRNIQIDVSEIVV